MGEDEYQIFVKHLKAGEGFTEHPNWHIHITRFREELAERIEKGERVFTLPEYGQISVEAIPSNMEFITGPLEKMYLVHKDSSPIKEWQIYFKDGCASSFHATALQCEEILDLLRGLGADYTRMVMRNVRRRR